MFTPLIVWSLLASIVVAAPRANSLFESKASLIVSRNLQTRGDKSGTTTASWNKNVELLTQVIVAGVNFSMVLDTGSADLWLFCTDGNDQMETGRHAYNPSTGKKLDGAKFDIKYGMGHAKGTVYMDKVTIGGITVDNQAIGCATDVDAEDVGDIKLDGLLGLGFDSGSKIPHNGHDKPVASATSSALNSISTKGGGILGLLQSDQSNAQLTWTENAYTEGKMNNGFFTVDIKKGEDGVYNFGFIDEIRFTTPLTYMPVVNWNQWIVKMSGFQIGNNGTKQIAERKALIDTGTTNILADAAIAIDYYSQVTGFKTEDQKSWQVPCNAIMPELRLTFSPPTPTGATHYPVGKGGVKQEEYTAVIPGINLIGNESGKDDNMCHGALESSDKGNGWDMILGDAFLESQLLVFDLLSSNGMMDEGSPTQGQIGFASKP